MKHEGAIAGRRQNARAAGAIWAPEPRAELLLIRLDLRAAKHSTPN